jgi:protein-tyrosine-phosphatase
MAEGLLRHQLATRGIDGVTVTSAGFRSDGIPPTDEAVLVMAERGIDISEHHSSRVDVERLRAADLVVAMARMHIREALVQGPDVLAHTFTLKELVRRGQEAGPRADGEEIMAWLGRMGGERAPIDYLGDKGADDIADPVGQPMRVYKKTAKELERLISGLVELVWPGSETP